MNKTPIEWCDFTVNPFRFRNLKTGKVGHHCTKISAGCKNCYSSTMQSGPYLSGLTFIEENKPKGEFFLDEQVLEQVLRRRKPARIFWCDMTDMFLEDYPDEWIDRCFAVMALTPHLTHQVLTKRAERMRGYFAANRGHFTCEYQSNPAKSVSRILPLENVWLGASAEDQPNADARIPHLLATPAALHFVSYEPALAPVDFRHIMWGNSQYDALTTGRKNDGTRLPHLDQIIVGGESGPCARPFDIAWARQTIAQCKAAGVACFVKQLGLYAVDGLREDMIGMHPTIKTAPCTARAWERGCFGERLKLKDRKGGDIEEWPCDLRVREMPEVWRGRWTPDW